MTVETGRVGGRRFTFKNRMPEWKGDRARAMRKHPTPAEDALWQRLRKAGRQVGPYGRWHRQHTMLGYIVDFWCAARKLVVEVDGPIHELREDTDQFRDAVFARYGVRTLRFTNDQVLSHMDDVLRAIQCD